MIWKTLIRTYILDFSLQALFDKILLNFGVYSNLSGRYLGPIQAGMFFRTAIYNSTMISGKRYYFKDVRIKTVSDVEHRGEDFQVVTFSHVPDIISEFTSTHERLRVESMEFYT